MMFNPRDPNNIPGEYDLIRQHASEARDAAQRATMADGREAELARAGRFPRRQTILVALGAALAIAAAVLALVWLAA
jgi:hypothetical protein